jgi:hypothetical protein
MVQLLLQRLLDQEASPLPPLLLEALLLLLEVCMELLDLVVWYLNLLLQVYNNHSNHNSSLECDPRECHSSSNNNNLNSLSNSLSSQV